MAYKKLIKVSNVCQVLDKSKIHRTHTFYGITFTKNEDGSVTVSGKPTDSAYYYETPIISRFLLKQGHTYLSPHVVLGTCYVKVKFINKNNEVQLDKNIYTADENSKVEVNIVVRDSFDGADTVLIPQLFDLTEMYGAGHEPTTVEQFRQDFPDEMYDYSPHCWLTSYKRVFMTGGGNYLTSYQRNLTCKTKNLFDINSANKFNGGPSFSRNGNQITVSNSLPERYKSANVLLDTSLVGKTISVTALAMTSGVNIANIRIQWLSNIGLAGGSNIHTNAITGNFFQKLTLTGVVPESPGGDFNNLCIMFYVNTTGSLETGVTYSATFTNIQLELSDTATDYVPYGHL